MAERRHPFRYEIRSARHLGELAAAPLPLDVAVSEPRRSQHRDLYLDTADEALRKRNIVCRLRLRSDDTRTLSLSIGGDAANPRAASIARSARRTFHHLEGYIGAGCTFIRLSFRCAWLRTFLLTVRQRGSELEHHLDLRLSHARSRINRGTGSCVHPGQRHGLRAGGHRCRPRR